MTEAAASLNLHRTGGIDRGAALQKVCLITGASRGIGAATARLAGRRGYAVAVNYARDEKAAKAVAAEIVEAGGKVAAFRADVSRDSDVEALFAAVDRDLGTITHLVNNAGIAGPRQPVGKVPAAELRRTIDVNLIGAFLCTQQAVRRMARSAGGAGGAIVNLSSTAARGGGHLISPYVASKAGIEGLTVALARELATEGIRVNAVSPGIVATDQQPLDDSAWRAKATERIPAGRLGEAAEVAEAILWLLSDEASYVSGTVLTVSGGM